ncbi:uncharacterized protein LOC113686776 [Pocillopora damicornis]|uniref:uncharacterized protein LOC113686776 n=1 Tax=Pocillopora damicornis TaxID=46731 RepID=UPI000F554D1F|nr:uncharacterized protein LOC113686776 [Pocillopora damicornis]
MDDGKDTTGLVAFGVEHSVETDFNSVPLKTGESVDDIQVITAEPVSTTISASSYLSPAVGGASPSSDCSCEMCCTNCMECVKCFWESLCCCLEKPEECNECLETLRCCVDILLCN